MRSLFALFVLLALTAFVQAEQPITTEPVSGRVIALCKASAVSVEDLTFLRSLVTAEGPTVCIAHALLFRHQPVESADDFKTYFRIDRTAPTKLLTDLEINERVNSILREFKGRSPAEQMTRIYLFFRRTGFVARKNDGSEMNLEMMFRASVFAATSTGSKEEVLRLASIADASN